MSENHNYGTMWKIWPLETKSVKHEWLHEMQGKETFAPSSQADLVIRYIKMLHSKCKNPWACSTKNVYKNLPGKMQISEKLGEHKYLGEPPG